MTAIATIQPSQSEIFRMIDNNQDLAPSTKTKYKRALAAYLETGNSLTDSDALAEYARNIGKSSRAFLKAAIRLWGKEIVIKAQSKATPENIAAVHATEARIKALNSSIKVKKTEGTKIHFWLNQKQVKALVDSCDDTIKGKRDRVILSLLVGAGLRREELSNLTFDDIQLVPRDNKFRTVVNVINGKGEKDRAIPVSDTLAAILDSWRGIVGGGKVARSVSKGGNIGDSISAIGIFHIVRAAGQAIGKPKLAPHDLRRTYAQLGYEAGVPITQISELLGHNNIATTQNYLNLELDLETTISDFVPL